MSFWTIDNKLESKDNFHNKIKKYYFEIGSDKIPINLLTELVDKITNTQYENYKRFWKQYPKSRKRYSELKIDDLEHPFNHYEIIDFLRKSDKDNYEIYAMTLLRMTVEEFKDFEIRKYQYETK